MEHPRRRSSKLAPKLEIYTPTSLQKLEASSVDRKKEAGPAGTSLFGRITLCCGFRPPATVRNFERFEFVGPQALFSFCGARVFSIKKACIPQADST